MFQNVNESVAPSHYAEERESVVLYNEGQKIFAILHKPKNVSHYPAVLFCHGLAGHKVGRYRAYVILAEALSALGIASLRFDCRGSGDSEGAFHDMTLDSEVSDTEVALQYLQTHPEIDSKSLALFGRSMGSAIAVLTACRYKSIKSLCLWAPVFHGQDWLDQWNRVQSNPNLAECKELLTIEGQVPGIQFFKEFFDMKLENEMEALNNIPMMFIHGNKDTMVPSDHSKKYLNARLGCEGETKYIELPESDHHFTNLLERDIAMVETCKWFVDTLK